MSYPGAPTASKWTHLIPAGWAVLGGFGGVVIGALGLVVQIALGSQKGANDGIGRLIRAVEESVPNWQLIELLKVGAVTALGAGLVIAGILLAFRFRVGRAYCYLYVPVAVALHVGYVWFEYAFVVPAVDSFIKQEARVWQANARWMPGQPPPPKVDTTASNVGMVLAAGMFVAHAVVLLVLVYLFPPTATREVGLVPAPPDDLPIARPVPPSGAGPA